MGYTLDTAAAKKANAPGRITETGAYIGIFTRAESVLSQKNTRGIEFTFVDDEENSADYLSLWTMKENGETIFGYNVLMSLMTCLNLRGITEKDGLVAKYDDTAKQVVNMRVPLYQELMHKRIGVLLQAEEYKARDGSIKTRMSIAGFFDPKTNLMAREILDRKTTPEMLDKAIKRMPPVRKLSGNHAAASGNSTSFSSGPSGTFDDDIPF